VFFEIVEFRVVFTCLFVSCVSPNRGLFGEICSFVSFRWFHYIFACRSGNSQKFRAGVKIFIDRCLG